MLRRLIVLGADAARQSPGFISLGLTSVLFLLALLPVPKRLESAETILGLVILGTAVVLGLRGVRKGRKIAKAGAWLSLGVLFLWVLAVCVVSATSIAHSTAASHR
jgi:hypothetical protein